MPVRISWCRVPVLITARHQYVSRADLLCPVDNRQMQKIGRKFDANLIFEQGRVEGTVWPHWPNYRLLMEAPVADAMAVFNAIFDPLRPTWQ